MDNLYEWWEILVLVLKTRTQGKQHESKYNASIHLVRGNLPKNWNIYLSLFIKKNQQPQSTLCIVCKWLSLFQRWLFICGLKYRQLLSVWGFDVFWKQWRGHGCVERNVVRNQRSVQKQRWARSCAPGEHRQPKSFLSSASVVCVAKAYETVTALPPLLFPFIYSALRWCLMTSNVCWAIRAGDYEAEKDFFIIKALVWDVLNVSEEVHV